MEKVISAAIYLKKKSPPKNVSEKCQLNLFSLGRSIFLSNKFALFLNFPQHKSD